MSSTNRSEYKNNWQKDHNDRINLTVSKGQKDVIKTHAVAQGESITAFINRAIIETIQRDQNIDQLKKEAEEKGVTFETLKADKQYKIAVSLVKARNPQLANYTKHRLDLQ